MPTQLSACTVTQKVIIDGMKKISLKLVQIQNKTHAIGAFN